MSDVTQEQVVDYIKGISVLELSQLVKTLEEELGFLSGETTSAEADSLAPSISIDEPTARQVVASTFPLVVTVTDNSLLNESLSWP